MPERDNNREDSFVAFAMYGQPILIGQHIRAPRPLALSAAHADHYQLWASRFYAEVAGNVGHCRGSLTHLDHSTLAKRRYFERSQILKDVAR